MDKVIIMFLRKRDAVILHLSTSSVDVLIIMILICLHKNVVSLNKGADEHSELLRASEIFLYNSLRKKRIRSAKFQELTLQ